MYDLEIDERMADLINQLMTAFRANDKMKQAEIREEIRQYEIILKGDAPQN